VCWPKGWAGGKGCALPVLTSSNTGWVVDCVLVRHLPHARMAGSIGTASLSALPVVIGAAACGPEGLHTALALLAWMHGESKSLPPYTPHSHLAGMVPQGGVPAGAGVPGRNVELKPIGVEWRMLILRLSLFHAILLVGLDIYGQLSSSCEQLELG